MAVNFLTLRSAVANDIAVQHLTYSTMVGHPTASHQTVQAIIASSIMTMGHVGIGATAALSGTALHVVGSTMISGNISIVGGVTGNPLQVNNNKTTGDDTPSFILRNNQTIPSQLVVIQKTSGAGAYNTITQAGDTVILSQDQRAGVAGANGIVICGQDQVSALRIGTTSSAFNGNLAISGNITINNGVGGTLTKFGSTVGYYATFTGGTADNSPFLEFWAGGSRRCYIGNANTTEVQFASENGAQLKFLTGGTSRLTIATGGDITASSNLTANCLIVNGGGTYQAGCIYSDINWGMLFRAKVVPVGGIFGWYDSAGTEKMKMLTDGSMTHTSGDSSYMRYGPNSQWNSNLIVGATPDRAGAGTAQVITTNGNLHIDAGNSRDIYYGFYAYNRGTPNPHYFFGGLYDFSAVPQNEVSYSHVACFNGDRLRRSQCMMRNIYFSNNVGWSGGINMTTAFYKHNGNCPVRISGKYSGFCGGNNMLQITLRIYSHSAGTYNYYYLNNFTNHGGNHHTVPLDHVITDLPYIGWYDIYLYNSSGWQTDTNDQLTVNVQLLPVNSF